MMLAIFIHRVLLLLSFLILLCKSNVETIFVEAIKNTEFENKRITDLPMITRKVRSKLECVVDCKKSPSCLSFTFNEESKDCDLYDQDFVYLTETQNTDETGWNYYHVQPGNIIDKSKCELPTVGICQSFCLFYRNGFWSNTVQDFIQACSVKGGEVIKVDRYLKQYCMGQAVDPVIGNDSMALNGIQDEDTGEWTHFDGTKLTFTFWDVFLGQPSYVSPSATPGAYEGVLATAKEYHYIWHDYSDGSINGVLCEIK